jgi:DNA-binding response OmpR family regulator
MAARVLIVDDEPYILRTLAFKLRRAGYVALEATNAE